MQSVSAAFTAEERDSVRKIAHNLQVSWHKQSTLGNRTFTIGVSLIGGNDIIGINPGAIGSPANYRYFDESSYVTALAWERGLSMPIGGLTKAMAEVHLDNTSGRFTPRHMGGNSELFTAIVPRRPMIINSGFNVGGVDTVVPQFAGIIDKQPRVNMKDRSVHLSGVDYVDFFQNRFLDQNVMFTGQRTDQVLGSLLAQLGMSTAQYDLDYGINIIPFGLFPSGSRFADVINKLVEAENGQFYQSEDGIFKFENRQHWDSTPYTQVQRIVLTGQVLDAQSPTDDHIINVVEVKGAPREKEENQLVWQSTGYAGTGTQTIEGNGNLEIWVSFDDPMLAIDTPVANGTTGQTSFYVANDNQDGTGNDVTSSVFVKSLQKFASTAKIVFGNNLSRPVYIMNIDIWGRPARKTGDVYYRTERGASVTAYEERPLVIENEFIQSQSWAESFGQMVIRDFAFPENLQVITIRAIPELQLGDLVSWQGRYWRIFDIKTTLDPSVGYVQELTMLQRTVTSYFRIGISTIGGSDKIAP
jgi:hypothetical protein